MSLNNDNYAVVEFLDEKTVEVVVKSWIENCDGVCFILIHTLFILIISCILKIHHTIEPQNW